MKYQCLLLILILFFMACTKDKVGTGCTLDDFIGTYNGTEECDGAEESATFTINKAGNTLLMTDNDGNTFELDVDDCSFDVPEVNLLIASFSGDGFINGDRMVVNVKTNALGFTANCRFEGRK